MKKAPPCHSRFHRQNELTRAIISSKLANSAPELGWFPAWWQVIIILFFMAASKAPSQEHSTDPRTLTVPRRVTVPRLKGRIKVDGELNEPVWAKGTRLEPFY